MPHVSIKGPALPVEKKRKLVKDVTKALSDNYGIPEEKFMIHVAEFGKESTASGGVLLIDK
jgi:4-oxalocrotonate tautomerase family enzyme